MVLIAQREFVSKFFTEFRYETLELEDYINEYNIMKTQLTILKLEKLLEDFKKNYSDQMIKEIKGDLEIHSRW